MLELLKSWPEGEPVPAFCVRQPWACAIAWLGKDVENRRWWPYHYRGPVIVIAASATPSQADFDTCAEILEQFEDRDELDNAILDLLKSGEVLEEIMPLGVIVAVADLWDVVAPDDEVCDDRDACTSPWASDGQTWVCLRDAIPVEPVPYRGQTRLIEVPYQVAASLRESSSEDAPMATSRGERGGTGVHVLVGEEAFTAPLEQAATDDGCPASWIVPKVAVPGDDVLLFYPHAGFLGHGKVLSTPESTIFGRRKTYRADVGEIVRYASPVLLDTVADQFPEWAWVRYPAALRLLQRCWQGVSLISCEAAAATTHRRQRKAPTIGLGLSRRTSRCRCNDECQGPAATLNRRFPDVDSDHPAGVRSHQSNALDRSENVRR